MMLISFYLSQIQRPLMHIFLSLALWTSTDYSIQMVSPRSHSSIIQFLGGEGKGCNAPSVKRPTPTMATNIVISFPFILLPPVALIECVGPHCLFLPYLMSILCLAAVSLGPPVWFTQNPFLQSPAPELHHYVLHGKYSLG